MYGPKRPAEIREKIGAEVLIARRLGTPWKLLERRFCYTEARLRMLAKAAAKAQISDISGNSQAERR